MSKSEIVGEFRIFHGCYNLLNLLILMYLGRYTSLKHINLESYFGPGRPVNTT